MNDKRAGEVYPFEVPAEVLENELERFVDVTVESLESQFITIPKPNDFIEFDEFEAAYRKLSEATDRFRRFTSDRVLNAVDEVPLVFVVMRTILGFTPSELAQVTTVESGVRVPQGSARSLDKAARQGRPLRDGRTESVRQRVVAMTDVASRLIREGAPTGLERRVHRLAKLDTEKGIESVQELARSGVPYSVLLYERFIGRPFAFLRDSVSEKVGAAIEEEIEAQLRKHGVPFQVPSSAERIPGFDQNPDFLVPDASEVLAVIEGKLTEDDGTARDKVTRIQHLRQISTNSTGFEVVACIDGRGFAVRREDMKKLLLATQGKVFTLATIDRLVTNTRLRDLVRSGTEDLE